MASRFGIAVIVLSAAAGCVPVALAAPALDTRVLIDISGSMKRTDPRNLRAPALRLLTALLPPGSQAGVWTFGRHASMEVAHGEVDEQWRADAREGAARIHSRGLFTNIELALRRATRGWQAVEAGARRNLVLLTDGMVDVSKEEGASEASRGRVLGELLEALVHQQARVLAIALSEEADHELLRTLAQATGGWYQRVTSAEELQRAFLRAFEKATEADTLPLDDNRFQVDESISELTLLLFRAAAAPETRLHSPDGHSFTAATAPTNVSWRSDQGYDLVTIAAPAVGLWRIEGRFDPDNRVLVVTDLRLQTSSLPNHFAPGSQRELHAFVSDAGEHIQRAGFTRLLHVFAEHQRPDGTADVVRLEPDDEHIFSGTLRGLDEEGEHVLSISASSDTFSRERNFSFRVAAPMAIAVGAAEQGYPLRISPRAEHVTVDSVRLDVRVQAGAGDVRALELERDGDTWVGRAGMLSAPHALRVHLSGRAPGGRVVDYAAAPIALGPRPAQPPAAAPQSAPESAPGPAAADWLTIAWQLAAANALLALVGAGAWWWRRHRRRTDELQLAGVES